MTGKRWRSAYDLFQAACDLPEQERTEFLRDLPADTRELIEGMLEDLRRDDAIESTVKASLPEIGSTVGRFSIEDLIGRGGRGWVYRAIDTHLNRPVAVKFLRPTGAGSESTVESFLNEAQAISALNYPNIVTVHEVIRSESSTAIVMELVEGTSFRHLTERPAPVESVARWGAQIAWGLAAAHARALVHRDIKPENLMLRPDGLVKILDFGLAWKIGSSETLEELPMGTIGYMSPEQLRGDPLTSATDMFSLGIVLWELATGSHPFLAESAPATTQASAASSPPSRSPTHHFPARLKKSFEPSSRRIPPTGLQHW